MTDPKDKIIKGLTERVNELEGKLHEKREWIGLSEDEVNEIRADVFKKYKKALLTTRDVTKENDYSAFNFYRAIEEKLRSKND